MTERAVWRRGLGREVCGGADLEVEVAEEVEEEGRLVRVRERRTRAAGRRRR